MVGVLPKTVVFVEASDPASWTDQTLLPAEAVALGRDTVAKRRREFAAGRTCARRALAALDVYDIAILRGTKGEPLWPPGIVGSITHCADHCGAAVARRQDVVSIGIDVEFNQELPANIEEIVCTASERHLVNSAPYEEGIHWPTVTFSAKESLYKAWFPLTRRWLDFDEVELKIDWRRYSFTPCFATRNNPLDADLAARFVGRFALRGQYIWTAVFLPA